MSVLARYCSRRRRRPTSSSSPRRLWWSCLCVRRCSVRSEIRRDSIATWTSGEPVSPSAVAYSVMICFFTSLASATPHSPQSQVCAAGRRHGGKTAHRTMVVRDVQDSRPDSEQQAAGLLDVPAHLLDQVGDPVELLHPADPLDELDTQLAAVDVGVEVEDERLHRAGAA